MLLRQAKLMIAWHLKKQRSVLPLAILHYLAKYYLPFTVGFPAFPASTQIVYLLLVFGTRIMCTCYTTYQPT